MASPFNVMNLLGVGSSSATTQIFVGPTSSALTLTGPSVTMTSSMRSALIFADIAQMAPSSSHTLDIWVQHSPDYGATFDDFARFSTVASSSGGATNSTSVQVAQWVRDYLPSSSVSAQVRAMTTQTLAAATVLQGPNGLTWRATAVAVGASASQPWKIAVSVQFGQ